MDPVDNLSNISVHKPQFDLAINKERQYFGLYEEWLSLDKYEFGEDSVRITREWLDEHSSKSAQLVAQLGPLNAQDTKLALLEKNIDETVTQRDNLKILHDKLTALYIKKPHYSWVQHSLFPILYLLQVYNKKEQVPLRIPVSPNPS